MNNEYQAKQSRLSPTLVTGMVLAALFGIALLLRVALPFDVVFGGDWIKFTTNDAYYHMRLVDNLVHNFPGLISSDPYMIHPGAAWITRIHFFDWLLASIILVVGTGSPTQHTIDVVGAYLPAILGALAVIPVYFIGKELFNRWAGLIAAGLIAIMPGEFIGQSALGVTDHDIAGILFTTASILFLILAVKAARQRGLNFDHFRRRDWAAVARPAVYSALSGFFLGLYLLTWAGALLFVIIIAAYFAVQFIIDHLKRHSTDYLCAVGVILFLVALVMFLPAAHDGLFTAALVLALLVPPVLSGISRLMNRRQIKPTYYPLTVVGLGLVGLFVIRSIIPLMRSIREAFSALFPSGVSLTTVEMQPLFFPSGEFSLQVAWGSFTTAFPFSLIALGILIYLVIKQGGADKSLLVVWSVVILIIMLGQRRFAAYFAINAALLTGYLSWQVFSLPSVREWLSRPARPPQPVEEEKPRSKKKKRRQTSPWFGLSSFIPFNLPGKIKINANTFLAGLVVLLFVLLPNLKPAIDTASNMPAVYAPSDAWQQSLSWLRENTDDPFGDPDYYYEFYQSSPPPPDYTVTAWWDYGYWITRIAHRVPNTNPGQGNVRQLASFLLSQDEDTAREIGDNLGTGYVIIDDKTALLTAEMVGDEPMVTGKLRAIAEWAQADPNQFFAIYYQTQDDQITTKLLFYPEYYRCLSTRLYNFDGEAVAPQSSTVISYRERISREGKPYREITELKDFSSYEEAAEYVSSQDTDNYRIVSTDPFVSPVPLEEVSGYRPVYSSDDVEVLPNGSQIPQVKIFEYIE